MKPKWPVKVKEMTSNLAFLQPLKCCHQVFLNFSVWNFCIGSNFVGFYYLLRGTFVSEFFLLMASVAVTISAVVVIVVVGVNDVRFRLLDDVFVEDTPDDVFNE